MKILSCEQGSPEWVKARLGVPTASRADSLITPAKLAPSSAQTTYMAELLAEWVLGVPLDDYGSMWMDRGVELEEDAIAWYGFERGEEVKRVGFCVADDNSFGCSPDGLVGDLGAVEIKCPAAKKHMLYLIEPERLYADYKVQVQSSLWLTGRLWWDLVSYNPKIKPVVYRVEPDPEFFAAFAPIVTTFNISLESFKNEYRKFDPKAGTEERDEEWQEFAEWFDN